MLSLIKSYFYMHCIKQIRAISAGRSHEAINSYARCLLFTGTSWHLQWNDILSCGSRYARTDYAPRVGPEQLCSVLPSLEALSTHLRHGLQV